MKFIKILFPRIHPELASGCAGVFTLFFALAVSSCSKEFKTTTGSNGNGSATATIETNFTKTANSSSIKDAVQNQSALTDASDALTRTLPKVFRGVTLEDVEDRDAKSPDSKKGKQYAGEIAQIAAAIKNNSSTDDSEKWITTRIVFDFDKKNKLNADNYKRLTSLLHDSSARTFVMGEFLDSKQLPECSVDCFQNRVDNYLSVLGSNVDVWEVGNEVNGIWTGPDISATVKKINIAAQKVKDTGGATVLTLYYNKECASSNEEIFNWIKNYSKDIKADNIDYVLASYYEDECKIKNDGKKVNRRPAPTEWKAFFQTVQTAFAHSTGAPLKVGFGEVGTKNKSAPKDEKLELIDYYYGTVNSTLSNDKDLKDIYVGGFFWWQYKYDMVFGKDKAGFNDKLKSILSRW